MRWSLLVTNGLLRSSTSESPPSPSLETLTSRLAKEHTTPHCLLVPPLSRSDEGTSVDSGGTGDQLNSIEVREALCCQPPRWAPPLEWRLPLDDLMTSPSPWAALCQRISPKRQADVIFHRQKPLEWIQPSMVGCLVADDQPSRNELWILPAANAGRPTRLFFILPYVTSSSAFSVSLRSKI